MSSNKNRVDVFFSKSTQEVEGFAQELKKDLKNASLYDEKNPNIVVFIGGDGTFLRAVQHYFSKIDSITFIGVNVGRLGFFCAYTMKETAMLIKDIKDNNFQGIKKRLLVGELKNKKKESKVFYAVNEIRIENPFRTINLDVFVDDEKLETFYGNGLNVSSTLGSTAYNRSLGGAIVTHNVDLLQLSEIATIQNREFQSLSSPLILGPKQKVSFAGNFKNNVIGFDHLNLSFDEVSAFETLEVTLSEKRVTIALRKGVTFITKLKETLFK